MVSAEKAGLRAGRPGAVRKGVRGWLTALPFILPGLILVAAVYDPYRAVRLSDRAGKHHVYRS